tara:strand:- start:428 stop:595 length:168 start_codon:yes stop_codon:yes gene_type:complete
MSLLEFYENYCLIEGKKPVIRDVDRWLCEGYEKGNIHRVWTRKYGFQYVKINKDE